jgi:hypothetical protein
MPEQREVNAYLNAIRESGSINMMAAGPYVQAEFGVNRYEAKELVLNWMKNPNG